jgi:hypothetical protein
MDTTVFSEINWLAVLIGAVAYWMLGAIWYSFLFQKQWVAYHKIDMNDPNLKGGMAAIMTASFVLMFVASLGIAILAERMKLTGWMSGAKLGAFTGLFFSATAISITYLYLKRPAGLHLIDGLYHVVGQMIAGIIICMWQ